MGYVEIYYEFKGTKVVKSALNFWSKKTGAVCNDWKVLEDSMANLIQWDLKTSHMARVNNKRNANFRCGNANSFRNFLKSGVITSITLRLDNHKSPFKLDSILVFYKIGRVPNVGTGNFMLLSQGKRAAEDSMGWNGQPQFAVDGNTEGRFNQRYGLWTTILVLIMITIYVLD